MWQKFLKYLHSKPRQQRVYIALGVTALFSFMVASMWWQARTAYSTLGEKAVSETGPAKQIANTFSGGMADLKGAWDRAMNGLLSEVNEEEGTPERPAVYPEEVFDMRKADNE